MNPTKLILTLLINGLICSCSPKNPAEKPQGVLTEAQKQTLDKAKKTEDVLDKANKERMKEEDGNIEAK